MQRKPKVFRCRVNNESLGDEAMQLTLTVEKGPDPALRGARFQFDQRGGTLGRSADNDWVLPDPDCYTSGRHARISLRNGRFVVEDLSTNGTFHNDPDRLIGKQRSVELNDGDQLYIGEFVLRVAIPEAAPPAAVQPASPAGRDALESLLDSLPATSPPQAIPERDEFDDLLEPPAPADLDRPEDDRRSDDEFGGGRLRGRLELDEDDAATGDSTTDPSAGRLSQSPEHEYFAAPALNRDPAADIPDEWDALLTGFFEPPARPASAPAPDRSSAGDDPASFGQGRGAGSATPESGSAPARAPNPRAAAKTPAPAGLRPPAGPSRSGGDAVMQQILRQLGIEDAAQEIDPEDFADQIGMIVRMVGEGLMQLLASRAEIKNELRIDQTRISSERNNPLKFSPTIEEAMRRVFVNRDAPGFLSGAESFEQALNDLRAHQVAILAAVQAAVESVIRQFDPEQLEGKLKKISPISASAPLIREAKCWNLFVAHYGEMATNLRQDARRVFVKEFAEAYERSAREIALQIAQNRVRQAAD